MGDHRLDVPVGQIHGGRSHAQAEHTGAMLRTNQIKDFLKLRMPQRFPKPAQDQQRIVETHQFLDDPLDDPRVDRAPPADSCATRPKKRIRIRIIRRQLDLDFAGKRLGVVNLAPSEPAPDRGGIGWVVIVQQLVHGPHGSIGIGDQAPGCVPQFQRYIATGRLKDRIFPGVVGLVAEEPSHGDVALAYFADQLRVEQEPRYARRRLSEYDARLVLQGPAMFNHLIRQCRIQQGSRRGNAEHGVRFNRFQQLRQQTAVHVFVEAGRAADAAAPAVQRPFARRAHQRPPGRRADRACLHDCIGPIEQRLASLHLPAGALDVQCRDVSHPAHLLHRSPQHRHTAQFPGQSALRANRCHFKIDLHGGEDLHDDSAGGATRSSASRRIAFTSIAPSRTAVMNSPSRAI